MYKTQSKQAQTPPGYIEKLPEPRRSELRQLHRLITKTAPHLKPKMWGEMIGYGCYHYRYATGREGDWFVVGLSSRRNYISFYGCLSDGRQTIAEKHKQELPKSQHRPELHSLQEARRCGPSRSRPDS